MKIVAMIPCRAGSKRIPKKNLRLLNGIPLVAYAIKAAKESHVFDEIYLNSEDEIFREIAEGCGIKFYKRQAEFATDESMNDDFMYDFLRNVQCDSVIQILCTSPFVSSQNVIDFHGAFVTGGFDTLVSVKNIQIECLYNEKALNFSRIRHTQPSQELKPVQAYACCLMAWNRNMFIKNYESFTGAYHGGNGRTGYYELTGFSTIDIDTEFDFKVAEAIALNISGENEISYKYYGEFLECTVYGKKPVNPCKENSTQTIYHTKYTGTFIPIPGAEETGAITFYPNKSLNVESYVPSILKKDGVIHNNLFDSNKTQINTTEIIERNRHNKNWSHRFVDTQYNSMVAVCQSEGQGNRLHMHPEWSEWWYIYSGKWKFEIEEEKRLVVAGDIVFIEKGKWHRIESLEDNSVRLAISRSDVAHVYKD